MFTQEELYQMRVALELYERFLLESLRKPLNQESASVFSGQLAVVISAFFKLKSYELRHAD